MGRHDDHSRNGHSRDTRRSRWRTGRRGRGPRRSGRWSRTRVDEVLRRGAESRRSALAAWADRPRDPVPDRLRRPSPGQPRSLEEHEPRKRCNQVPPGQPKQEQRTRGCPPRGASTATSAGSNIARTTPVLRARTWTGDASEHEGRRRARHRRERRFGRPRPRAPSPRPSCRRATTTKRHRQDARVVDRSSRSTLGPASSEALAGPSLVAEGAVCARCRLPPDPEASAGQDDIGGEVPSPDSADQ